eukprot:7610455-Ditylum_brightwellii.AAC.1
MPQRQTNAHDQITSPSVQLPFARDNYKLVFHNVEITHTILVKGNNTAGSQRSDEALHTSNSLFLYKDCHIIACNENKAILY